MRGGGTPGRERPDAAAPGKPRRHAGIPGAVGERPGRHRLAGGRGGDRHGASAGQGQRPGSTSSSCSRSRRCSSACTRPSSSKVPGRVASPGLRLAGADDEAATFAAALAVAIRRLGDPGPGADGPFPALLPAQAGGATLAEGGPLARYRDEVAESVAAASDALGKLTGLGGMFRHGDGGAQARTRRGGSRARRPSRPGGPAATGGQRGRRADRQSASAGLERRHPLRA